MNCFKDALKMMPPKSNNLLRAVDGAAAVSVAVVVKKEFLQLFVPLHQVVDDIELPSNSGILKRTENAIRPRLRFCS